MGVLPALAICPVPGSGASLADAIPRANPWTQISLSSAEGPVGTVLALKLQLDQDAGLPRRARNYAADDRMFFDIGHDHVDGLRVAIMRTHRRQPGEANHLVHELEQFGGGGGSLKGQGFIALVELSGLRLVREQIMVEGNFLAARTTFSGDFTGIFAYSPIGPVEPTGRHLEWEVIGIFRYNDEDRLAEEWVQTDYRSFLTKLGVTTTESALHEAMR
jgi:SnoaL-like polyketide cyclase